MLSRLYEAPRGGATTTKIYTSGVENVDSDDRQRAGQVSSPGERLLRVFLGRNYTARGYVLIPFRPRCTPPSDDGTGSSKRSGLGENILPFIAVIYLSGHFTCFDAQAAGSFVPDVLTSLVECGAPVTRRRHWGFIHIFRSIVK